MSSVQSSVLTPESVKVGDGVTYRVGSDRYAATVTKVSPSGKTIWFTDDEYKAGEGHNYYGNQKYEYTSVPEFSYTDPMGETRTNVRSARWSAKRSGFVFFGGRLSAGRHAYSDPHF